MSVMSNVYLICEKVDLGFHVVCATMDEEKADAICERMNEEEINHKIEGLMATDYTKEEALQWISDNHYIPYFIDIHELIE